MSKGLFITVEGIDGSGKSTQIQLIEIFLKEKGYDVLLLREPGGTSIGEKIRSIILDAKNKEMADTTEMLLYAAARAQIVKEIIKPAIEAGKAVICDRFIHSSYVYQGYGRGIELKMIELVNSVAMGDVFPNITFFFDITPKEALKRRSNRGEFDRIEMENMDFYERVYEGYKDLAKKYPEVIKTIDARGSVEEVFEQVRGVLANM